MSAGDRTQTQAQREGLHLCSQQRLSSWLQVEWLRVKSGFGKQGREYDIQPIPIFSSGSTFNVCPDKIFMSPTQRTQNFSPARYLYSFFFLFQSLLHINNFMYYLVNYLRMVYVSFKILKVISITVSVSLWWMLQSAIIFFPLQKDYPDKFQATGSLENTKDETDMYLNMARLMLLLPSHKILVSDY